MTRKTGISVMDNLGIRREVKMEVGSSNGYESGLVLDANATAELVKNKVDEIIGGASTALDTLKELGDAIPTKVSELTNDAGYITQHQDISEKADKEYIESLIANLEDGGYGISIKNGGVPSRIGNTSMHKSLPIQNKMRRCVIKNGNVVGYINPADYTRYTTGELVDYTGGDGDIMVEIPEYYYEAYRYQDNNDTVDVLILHPYAKIGKKSKKCYVSAMEATSDGTTLSSICTTNFTVSNNTVDATALTYTSNAATYRGGNKSNTNDGNAKSLLGRPITSLTRATFRTRAAAKGAGWSLQYWDAYMSFVRLYVVEYANLNSQDTFNTSLTADGYKQGGLGVGVSNVNDAEWNDFNGRMPLVPCGITRHLVNTTGVVNITYPAGTLNETTTRTFAVPSYRGIENPFGHIFKWTDGININTVEGTTTVYTTNNIVNFADDTSTNYEARCSFTKPENGYIKTWNWDANGDFIPTSIGGSSASYLCDYSSWGDGWRVLRSGGYASIGASCGLFCFSANGDSGNSIAYVGGRLYYTPAE